MSYLEIGFLRVAQEWVGEARGSRDRCTYYALQNFPRTQKETENNSRKNFEGAPEMSQLGGTNICRKPVPTRAPTNARRSQQGVWRLDAGKTKTRHIGMIYMYATPRKRSKEIRGPKRSRHTWTLLRDNENYKPVAPQYARPLPPPRTTLPHEPSSSTIAQKSRAR